MGMEFVPKTSENLHVLMWPSARENLIVIFTSLPQLPSLHGCNIVWLTNVYEECANKRVTERQPSKHMGYVMTD
jgi:hypothetical protein